MTTIEIVVLAAGFGVPLLLAPVAIVVLRRLFALFLSEGMDLFGDFSLQRNDAVAIGALLARYNVLILLVAWLALFTCKYFDLPHMLLMSIALTGVLGALVTSIMIVKSTVEMEGSTLMVGLLAFAGGNLPIIVIVAAILAITRMTG